MVCLGNITMPYCETAKILCILCFCISFVLTSDPVPEMITSLISNDRRPTSIILTNWGCWKKNQVNGAVKYFMNKGSHVSLRQNVPQDYTRLHHIMFVVSLHCPRSYELLYNMSNEDLIRAPYRWILLDTREEAPEVNLELMKIFIDSDVMVVKRVSENDFALKEVYKIDPNENVIQIKRGVYNIEGKKAISVNRSYDSSMIEVDNTLRKEDDTSVVAKRRWNLREHRLTMANVIIDSNETRYHLDDRMDLGHDSITKMSYMVVKVCFDMINATPNIVFTSTWGYQDKHGNWQGMIDQMIHKKADLGTLSIFSKDRTYVIDYIAMIGSTSVRFVFREPPLSYVTNIYALPFSRGVWLAMSICVLACAVFLYFTSKWEASVDMHPMQLSGSWADIFILTISAMFQRGCNLEPRFAAGRMLTFFLFLTLMALYSAYSAYIVVLLRAPSSTIRSLQDLLNSPMTLGASDLEYNRYFFKNLNETVRKAIYQKKIAPKGSKPHFYSMREGVEKIRKGLFAFHMEVNPGYRLIQETYQEIEKCDLVEMDYINEFDPWLPMQKRSPFKEHFKISFMRIRESGVQAAIHKRLHVPRPRCSGSVSAFSSVGIVDLYSALLLTLYGFLLAPTVLLFELVWHRLEKRAERTRKNNKKLKNTGKQRQLRFVH